MLTLAQVVLAWYVTWALFYAGHLLHQMVMDRSLDRPGRIAISVMVVVTAPVWPYMLWRAHRKTGSSR